MNDRKCQKCGKIVEGIRYDFIYIMEGRKIAVCRECHDVLDKERQEATAARRNEG